uniref:Uncharacterized protein n=1 Tax=Lygus hesperus TaxID=30085 RepID=A0A146LZY3_LYGHE
MHPHTHTANASTTTKSLCTWKAGWRLGGGNSSSCVATVDVFLPVMPRGSSPPTAHDSRNCSTSGGRLCSTSDTCGFRAGIHSPSPNCATRSLWRSRLRVCSCVMATVTGTPLKLSLKLSRISKPSTSATGGVVVHVLRRSQVWLRHRLRSSCGLRTKL